MLDSSALSTSGVDLNGTLDPSLWENQSLFADPVLDPPSQGLLAPEVTVGDELDAWFSDFDALKQQRDQTHQRLNALLAPAPSWGGGTGAAEALAQLDSNTPWASPYAMLDAPDLVAQIQQVGLSEQAVPGERGTIQLHIYNQGTASAQGSMLLRAFAISLSDTTAEPIEVGQARTSLAHLEAGAAQAETIQIQMPHHLPPGDYDIAVLVDANHEIAERDELNNGAISDAMQSVRWQFGRIQDRSLRLRVSTAEGKTAIFAIAGAGQGEVLQDGSLLHIRISGTDGSSRVLISGDRDLKLGHLSIDGDLDRLAAPLADLQGTLSISGSLDYLQLDDLEGGNVLLNGTDSQGGVSIRLDHLHHATISSQADIRSFVVNGSMDPDSRVVAKAFTGPIDIQGQTVDPDLDARFLSPLKQVWQRALLYLDRFSHQPLMAESMQVAFGETFQLEAAQQQWLEWIASPHAVPSFIHLLDDLPYRGAFSAQAQAIFLSAPFLLHSLESPDLATETLLQELGHWLDARFNTADAPGDEGAIFAQLLLSGSIDPLTLEALRHVDDVATLVIQNQPLSVELSASPTVITGTAQNDTLIGSGDKNDIFGRGGNDRIEARRDDDRLYGEAGDDVLLGELGDDRLDGGTGNDVLRGGDGNDLYLVDSSADQVIELENEGIDTVYASVSYTLPTHVEHLSLSGSAFKATGNALNNTIKGTNSANILDGKEGADFLAGSAGDDLYYVDHLGDIVSESPSAGIDTVYASISYTLPTHVEHLSLSGSAFKATGNALNNTIKGTNSANILDGKEGADFLAGSGGNDTYYVDHVSDWVSESETGGVDLVIASVNYSLSNKPFVEQLTITGSAVAATGNDLSNTIKGNEGANILNGLGGADFMAGSAGDDTYYVDHLGDNVSEGDTVGVDLIITAVDYSISSRRFVEHLTLTGTALTATGNALANSLTGNGANNTLLGLGGNDVLSGGAGDDRLQGASGADVDADSQIDRLAGGAGADTFVIHAATDTALPYIGSGYAIISDFQAGLDSLQLSHDALSYSLMSLHMGGDAAVDDMGLYFHGDLVALLLDTTDLLLLRDARFGSAAGVLQFESSSYSVNEAEATLSVSLMRGGGAAGPISVELTANDGSARSPDDYQWLSQTISFAHGELTKTIHIPITDDPFYEDTESFSLTLANPSGGASLGAITSSSILITDNDAPSPLARHALLVVGETDFALPDVTDDLLYARLAGLGFSITVVDDEEVQAADAAGLDLLVVSESVSASAIGNTLNSVTVPVLALEPFIFDNLKLTGPSSAVDFGFASGFSLYQDGTVVQIYTANGQLAWGDVSPDATVFASLNGEPQKAAVFGYQPGDTLADNSSAPGFRAGFFARRDFVDDLTEAGWLLFDHIVNWTSSTPHPSTNPGTFQFELSEYSLSEGDTGMALEVTIIRSGGTAGEVSLSLESSDGSASANADFFPLIQTLTFADGEASKTIQLSILDDAIHEATESFYLTLSNPSGGASLGAVTSSSILITDNDPDNAQGRVSFSSPTYTLNEDGSTTAQVTLVRTDGNHGAISVSVSSLNASASAEDDFQTLNQVVSFADGETEKLVDLLIVDDSYWEGTETFFLRLENPTDGAQIGEQDLATVSIIDNDPAPGDETDDGSAGGGDGTDDGSAGGGDGTDDEDAEASVISFGNASYIVNEEESTAVEVTLVRSGDLSRAVEVMVSSIDGDITVSEDDDRPAQASEDYQALNQVVTFAAGESSKNILVSINNDDFFELDEFFSLVLETQDEAVRIEGLSSTKVTIESDDADRSFEVAGFLDDDDDLDFVRLEPKGGTGQSFIYQPSDTYQQSSIALNNNDAQGNPLSYGPNEEIFLVELEDFFLAQGEDTDGQFLDDLLVAVTRTTPTTSETFIRIHAGLGDGTFETDSFFEIPLSAEQADLLRDDISYQSPAGDGVGWGRTGLSLLAQLGLGHSSGGRWIGNGDRSPSPSRNPGNDGDSPDEACSTPGDYSYPGGGYNNDFDPIPPVGFAAATTRDASVSAFASQLIEALSYDGRFTALLSDLSLMVELSLLANAYEQLAPQEPTSELENDLSLFLDILWREYDCEQSSWILAGNALQSFLDQFSGDAAQLKQVIGLNRRVLEALLQVDFFDGSLDAKALETFTKLSGEYASFKPDADNRRDKGVGFFLDTFWNQSGFTSTQKGTDEFKELLDSFDSDDNAVQFVENVLTVSKQTPIVKDNPKVFRQFTKFANSYATLKSEIPLLSKPGFFMDTLLALRSESQNGASLDEVADQFKLFLSNASQSIVYERGIRFEENNGQIFLNYISTDDSGNETDINPGGNLEKSLIPGSSSDFENVRVQGDTVIPLNTYALTVKLIRTDSSEEIYPGDQVFTFLLNSVEQLIDEHNSVKVYPGDKLFFPTTRIAPILGEVALTETDTIRVLERLEAANRVIEAFDIVDEAIATYFDLTLNEISGILESPAYAAFAGLAIGGFVGIQFTPAAPFLNAALLLLSGMQGVTEFINFFRKASSADSIESLYDAASHIPKFLETLLDVPGAGSEISGVLGAIGSLDNAFDAFRRFFQNIDTLSLPNITRISANVSETSVNLASFLDNIVKNGLGDITEGFVALFTASINLFKNQDSPLSRLLQYADAQVVNNLINAAVDNFPQNPENADQILTFLGELDDIWKNIDDIATQIDELPEVRDAIAQHPNSLNSILEFGSEAIDILVQRLEQGDNLVDWTRNLAESTDVGTNILLGASRNFDPTELPAAGDLFLYGRVLALDNDVFNIASDLGIDPSIIERVRIHRFQTEHVIPLGSNNTVRAFFTPVKEDIELWIKAAEGSLTNPAELEIFKRFLVHEYVESRLMELGLPFKSSHPDVYDNTLDTNLPTSEHYGAHDLAPVGNEGEPFRVWISRLNQSPGDLERLRNGDDLLNNLEEIVQETYRIFGGQ